MEKAEARVMRKLHYIFQEFRALSDSIGVQQAVAFLQVAEQEGLTVMQLANLCDMSSASATRNLQYWSKEHRSGAPGFNFIRLETDPMDARRKFAFLTNEGKDFAHKVLRHLA